MVARAVVCQPTDHGGFSVVNIEFKTSALLVQWVRRFTSSPNTWVSLMTFWYFDSLVLFPLKFSPCLSFLTRPFCCLFIAPCCLLVVFSPILPILFLSDSLSCKSVYLYVLSLKKRPTHYITKFLPTYGSLYWPSTWHQLFMMPLDRKVIDLNWKVCHGVLYTAARLSSFGYNHSTICFCGSPMETSEHLFFSCPLAHSGIDWIQSLLFGASPLAPPLAIHHVLFGFNADKMCCVPCVFVYLLLVCKYLIWIQRNDFRFHSV